LGGLCEQVWEEKKGEKQTSCKSESVLWWPTDVTHYNWLCRQSGGGHGGLVEKNPPAQKQPPPSHPTYDFPFWLMTDIE